MRGAVAAFAPELDRSGRRQAADASRAFSCSKKSLGVVADPNTITITALIIIVNVSSTTLVSVGLARWWATVWTGSLVWLRAGLVAGFSAEPGYLGCGRKLGWATLGVCRHAVA